MDKLFDVIKLANKSHFSAIKLLLIIQGQEN